MNIRAILESKLDSETIVKLGEANLAKLSEITIEDEAAESVKAALLSLTEAENSPSIVGKNKDKWHKEAKKAFMDSIDSTLADHLDILGDVVPTETKDKSKGIVTAYKTKVDTLIQELALLKKEGVSDADSKALIHAKELEIVELKKNYVPSESVKAFKDENDELKKELDSFKKASIREKITNSAIKSGILKDFSADIVDDIIYGAVKKYTETELLGIDKVKAKVILDKSTKQLVVRNSTDETMSVVSDGILLTLDELVKLALIKYDLNKKSESQEYVPFKQQSPANPNKSTQIIEGKYF